MALFLAVLGGAAVVEVHRAITGGGNKDRDLQLLKQREELLRRQLQVSDQPQQPLLLHRVYLVHLIKHPLFNYRKFKRSSKPQSRKESSPNRRHRNYRW